jgi:hypothetical protein
VRICLELALPCGCVALDWGALQCMLFSCFIHSSRLEFWGLCGGRLPVTEGFCGAVGLSHAWISAACADLVTGCKVGPVLWLCVATWPQLHSGPGIALCVWANSVGCIVATI